jgi:hypothetical protein
MNRLAAAATLYRQLGWSPGHTGCLVWLRAGRVVDALELPCTLGQRTLPLLPTESPLFEVIGLAEARWVFLTQFARLPVGRLAVPDAEHITGGRTIDLPPSQYDQCRMHWLTAPTLPLPQFMTVADAIMRAAT